MLNAGRFLNMHKSQVFFWSLASFLGGIFVASVFNISQTFIYAGFMAAIGLVGVFGYNKSFNGKLMLAGFLGIALLFGAVRLNSVNFSQDRLDFFTGLKAGGKGIEVVVNGYVDSEPTDRGERQEFVLKAKQVVAGNRIVEVDDKVLVTTDSFPKFKYGEIVSATGSLEKPANFTPSTSSGRVDFDYVTYLKKDGIRATMFYPDILDSNGHFDSLMYQSIGFFEKANIGLYKKIFFIKKSFESAVSRSVPEPNAAFINGILLGSRQNIPDDLKESFNKTGTTHMLAISGYNIMIISWAVLAGLIMFFRRRVAFWISVVVIILFTVLTGASASVVRASIMGLLLLFANGYGRLYNPKNSIILAGAIMVWVNPLALVFDIGFQLSFSAVIGLMYLYPRLNLKLKRLPEFGVVKETVLMTVSAQAAVAPLLIYYFRNFSLVSLPANILVAPFLPASMLFGFTAGLGGMVLPVVGQIVGWLAWAITVYQIGVIRFFAGF